MGILPLKRRYTAFFASFLLQIRIVLLAPLLHRPFTFSPHCIQRVFSSVFFCYMYLCTCLLPVLCELFIPSLISTPRRYHGTMLATALSQPGSFYNVLFSVYCILLKLLSKCPLVTTLKVMCVYMSVAISYILHTYQHEQYILIRWFTQYDSEVN